MFTDPIIISTLLKRSDSIRPRSRSQNQVRSRKRSKKKKEKRELSNYIKNSESTFFLNSRLPISAVVFRAERRRIITVVEPVSRRLCY